MDNQFSTRLNELLIERGLKKNEFAFGIQVTPAIVSLWTQKKRQPTAENIYNAAKYLEVSSDYLLGLSEEE